VREDAASRALYAVDGSNYRVLPDLVVVPADADDLAAAVSLTAAAGAPVTMRGGGTSTAQRRGAAGRMRLYRRNASPNTCGASTS
jgi:FAD/FMN-containing dehydrogenase